MKKISINDLVDFHRKSERSRSTFVNNIKLEKKPKDNSDGGDYWISCVSAISKIYTTEDINFFDEKIEYLQDKIESTDRDLTKLMHQQNINILDQFRDFDFSSIKPNANLNYHKLTDAMSTIDINGLTVKIRPNHIFSFTNNGNKEIGAVWFVAKKKGYEINELGMFTDILFRSLNNNFSNNHYINPNYCIAVDIFNGKKVNYTNIQNGDIPIMIDRTINEIKNILQVK